MKIGQTPEQKANSLKEHNLERFLKQLIPSIAGLAVLVFGLYLASFASSSLSKNPADWGTLGDYFGGLMNPVISFATLMVAFAVWRHQKEELRQTKIALEEQAKTAEQQRREQRFFDLLNVYFRTLESVQSQYIRTIKKWGSSSGSALSLAFGEEVGSELVVLNGKSAISHQRGLLESRGKDDDEASWWGALKSCIAAAPDSEAWNFNQKILAAEWIKVQSDSDIGPLLRTVTIILSEAELLLGDDHKRYVDIFIAQLSDDELTLLGYYMWLDQSDHQLLPVARKYSLLRNMKRRLDEFQIFLPAEVFAAPSNTDLNRDSTPC